MIRIEIDLAEELDDEDMDNLQAFLARAIEAELGRAGVIWDDINVEAEA